MTKRPVRVLLLSAHPVQYASPIFRLLAQDSRVQIKVAYCSMEGSEAAVDPDFGVEVKWDIPLLDGYPWIRLPNLLGKPKLNSFFGLCNTSIWPLIRHGDFDVVVSYTGYVYATFWMAIAAAKLNGLPVLFGTDATAYSPRDGRNWKIRIKKRLLPRIFRLADIVIVPSEAGRDFIRSMGILEPRIALTPFVVDNAWWLQRASQVDRIATRREWQVPEDATVALFCAKLQPWKRPQDALRAFAEAGLQSSFLVFAGDGVLRPSLEAEAETLGVRERVRFLGFVNQSGLPAVYRSCDLLVMPSEYDPCPVVVCEAMLCGCPVVLSDEIRGRFELVNDGITGFIYPCGNVQALSEIVSNVMSQPDRLKRMGSAAIARMATWTPRENVDATVRAIEQAHQQKTAGRASSEESFVRSFEDQ